MAKAKKATPRKDRSEWERFETFVYELERLLSERGARVKLNDQVRSRFGNLRQCDATVRIGTGTTELLILIECRNRKKVSDVLWIEQLATKRLDLRAARVVVVTNKPLSSPALQAAAHHDIQTRTLETVDPAEFPALLGSFWFERVSFQWVPTAFRVEILPGQRCPPDMRPAMQRWSQDPNAPRLRIRRARSHAFEAVDVHIGRALDVNPYPDIPPRTSEMAHSVRIDPEPGENLEIEYEGWPYRVAPIVAAFRAEITRTPSESMANVAYDFEGQRSYYATNQRMTHRDASVVAVSDPEGQWLKISFPQGLFTEQEIAEGRAQREAEERRRA